MGRSQRTSAGLMLRMISRRRGLDEVGYGDSCGNRLRWKWGLGPEMHGLLGRRGGERRGGKEGREGEEGRGEKGEGEGGGGGEKM